MGCMIPKLRQLWLKLLADFVNQMQFVYVFNEKWRKKNKLKFFY